MELLDVCTVLTQTLYYILLPIFNFIYRKKPPSIPPIKNPLLKLSAATLAKKIREGEISSEEVVYAYVKRIQEVNPYINAVVEERFTDALNEAKSYDKKLQSKEITILTLEKEKPLYGVPFTVKESCGLKGMSQTGCTLTRKHIKAPVDSFIVESLKKAGAIPLCVTNTPEMCCNFDSANLLYGGTSNPYDTRYTAGGSSGGEGALLGAGASLIGIGSDIGGSIRIPAHFNGIFGHKPTPGIIPVKGHYPLVDAPNFQKYLVLGPMTRYAEDLFLTMKVMSSASGYDLRFDEPVHMENLKVYYMDNVDSFFRIRSTTPDIRESIKKATNYLAERGATVQQLSQDWLGDMWNICTAMFFREVEIPPVLVDNDNPKRHVKPIVELIKGIFGLSQYTKSASYTGVVANLNGLTPLVKFPHYKNQAEATRKRFHDLLKENEVFIFPTYPHNACYKSLVNIKIDCAVYSLLINMLHLPSTHVPMGLSEGLPIGFQVVAGSHQDRLCLAVAKELEKKFGGWIPPNEKSI